MAEFVGVEFLPTVRWLLTRGTGVIADIAHRAEIHGAELDDNGRAELADDPLALDEELGTLHTLLVGPVDWIPR